MKFCLGFLIFLLGNIAFGQSLSENKTETYFNSIKQNPPLLFQFLSSMPKGGDLHNHESGATLAENMIHYAAKDHFCVNRTTLAAYSDSTCSSQNLLVEAVKDPTFYDALIDAWSMRHFHAGSESGHDHFFATFGKFSPVASLHAGEILAEVTERAGKENESYLELMTTPDADASGLLGKKLGWNSDFATMREKLLASEEFKKIVKNISTKLTEDTKQKNKILACETIHPQVGCHVKVRYLYQILREQTPEMVFAQLLAGFESAKKDARIVGINMVQPEDGHLSMQDYQLHMKMVGYLHHLYPQVSISLHAGELTRDLVSAEGLTFHINEAVQVANANRIGHGVDVMSETNASQLLTEMAKRHIMVEINLTSNDEILQVKGKNHPLPVYMQYGVPVALSTDDEGVSRGNLTKEFERAVLTYQLSYATLKQFARNSLTYAFLPGKTLWLDNDYKMVTPACQKDELGSTNISRSCKRFLILNQKAEMQWELEKRFTNFENHFNGIKS